MAEDVATITARLKTQYPTLSASVDGERVTLDATAYDARIAEMASALRQQQLEAEADAARVLLRKKYRAAKTELAIAVTAGNAVTRLTNTRTIIDGLLEILKDSGLVLDD
jgi:long-subunit acyl-CoA synthetase (AMP-forming)